MSPKSSFSGADSCVNVEILPHVVCVSHADAIVRELRFIYPEWAAFVLGVKAGEFDLPTEVRA